ncbi:MAG: ATP-binding cassette domain-containing protein [Firmicutes bacterium]|nr:ATP-binding cassette domain-containing protein [Bacillota bacterium]
MERLVLKDITLKYYGNPALRIDELKADTPLGVLGCGGAGKSSLIKVIAGLEEIESGEIYINGREVGSLAIKERNISLVSSRTPLMKRKSVYQNLVYPLKKRGVKREGQKRAVKELSAVLPEELKENLHKKSEILSPQGVAALLCFRAMIKKPDLILVDEPHAFIEDFGCFAWLLKQSGVMFIVASYDFELLSLATERFIVIRRGEIIFGGEMTDIAATDDKYIRAMCHPTLGG